MHDIYSGQTEIKVTDIAGTAEVAEIIGYSKAYVVMLLHERPDFPRPVTIIKGGRIWDAEAVRQWRKTYKPKYSHDGEDTDRDPAKDLPGGTGRRGRAQQPSAEDRAATLNRLLAGR